MPSYHVASDIGGTFTDTVVIDSDGFWPTSRCSRTPVSSGA